MSRSLRIEFSGALYHLTSRGDGHEAIYLDDSDRALSVRVGPSLQPVELGVSQLLPDDKPLPPSDGNA